MEKILTSLFTKKPSLFFCILMDLIGMASLLLPALGEWSDLIWAPLSAYIFYKSFGSIGGLLGGAFSFLEEIIPFTDLIPTFTLAWFIQQQNTDKRKSNLNIEDAEIIEIS
ncbi:MAG: hypothetical protein IPF62_16005 [Bacteroidetes bacterium]|nr:hypothetical protein [Bacteroidota bacterium]